jgi:RHS repeat-associated protein
LPFDTGSYTAGTTRYGYDADGNLTEKIAPMPNQTTVSATETVTTAMTYDQLNRLRTKTYANNDNITNTTPSVTMNYDEASALGVTGLLNTDGRESSATVASFQGGEVLSYDKLGRVTINSQCTPQNCSAGTVFPITYQYDLLGDMTSSTNGMSVSLTYFVNRAQRLTSLTSSLSDSNHPGLLYSGLHYNAIGSVISASFGNSGSNISEARTYDGQLRLASITDGSIYGVSIPASGGYAPNGDILQAIDSVNGTWTYAYDPLNRLCAANQSSTQPQCGQSALYTYAYDRFGNRWQQNGTNSMILTFSGNNNHMDGYSYDAAGNLLSDLNHSYTYDSENRLTLVDSGTTATYVYDANGRRIRKTKSGGTADFLYDLAGHEIAEVGSTGGWNRGEVYVADRHIATYSGGISGSTTFNLADWLGTERARATAAGVLYETCTGLPFGDGLTCTAGDPSPMHFTGKERDSESGLDSFGARYNSSAYGRFMSPDAKIAGLKHLLNPQKLNRYAYTLNNPLRYVDLDGMEELEIQLRAFIPQYNVFVYKGDDRGPTTSQAVTSRTEVSFRVQTDQSKLPAGSSPLLGPGVGKADPTENLFTGNKATQSEGLPGVTSAKFDANGNVVVTIQQNSVNPLAPPGTAGIRSDLTLTIPADATSVTVSGSVSNSPAFELNVFGEGGSSTNISLQSAATNSLAFVAGLYETDNILVSKPLPPEPPCKDEAGTDCGHD